MLNVNLQQTSQSWAASHITQAKLAVTREPFVEFWIRSNLYIENFIEGY